MHVVDFSRNHWSEAVTFHPIDEACPKRAPGRIEHPGCSAQTFPITVNVACGALNDLHAVAGDDIRQKRWRRRFPFGQKHDCSFEFTREQPAKQFSGQFAQQSQSDLGVFFSQRQNGADKRPLGQGMREPDAQEAVRFSVGRRNRFQRLRPLQQISRLFEHFGAERVQARRFDRAVEQLSTQCSLQPLELPGDSGWCPV